VGLILVDTSIWADHLGRPDPRLSDLIAADRSLLHPYVLTELALGNLADWPRRILALQQLPSVAPLSNGAVLELVARQNLQGSGLGFVDAHLLGATLADPGRRLWSRDRRLLAQAEAAGMAWTPV